MTNEGRRALTTTGKGRGGTRILRDKLKFLSKSLAKFGSQKKVSWPTLGTLGEMTGEEGTIKSGFKRTPAWGERKGKEKDASL